MKFLLLIACISMQIYISSSKHVLQTCTIAKTTKSYGECLKNLFDQMQPNLLNGIPEHNVPSLNPFKLKEHFAHQTIPGVLDLQGFFRDVEVHGFDKLQLKSIGFNPKALSGDGTSFLPYFTLKTNYFVEGNILGRNIKDQGSIEVTIKNMEIKGTTNYKLVNIDGKDYIQLENLSAKFLVGKAHAKVVSSTPELQFIADAALDIFHRNPQAILSTLYQMFGEVVNQFVMDSANKHLLDVPADEIIPQQFL